jgi:hypothetical protein
MDTTQLQYHTTARHCTHVDARANVYMHSLHAHHVVSETEQDRSSGFVQASGCLYPVVPAGTVRFGPGQQC